MENETIKYGAQEDSLVVCVDCGQEALVQPASYCRGTLATRRNITRCKGMLCICLPAGRARWHLDFIPDSGCASFKSWS